MRRILSESIAVSFIRRIYNECCGLASRTMCIYKNSLIGKITAGFRENIKIGFKYCFLGRVSVVSEKAHTAILNNSKILNRLSGIYKTCAGRLKGCARPSAILKSLKTLMHDFCAEPVKITGFILIFAVSTNLLLSLALKRKIGALGWVMIILILFIAMAGLFYRVRREDLKKTSFLLKRLNNSLQKGQ